MTSEHEIQRILARDATAALLGVNIRTLERMVAAREFPRPIRLSRNRLGFVASEVSDWIESRERAG